MRRTLWHHGDITARALRVGITVALGLTLGTQAVTARECQRETPLPAEVRLMAPGPEVPEAVARFAGAWVGEWDDSGGLCHTLIVEAVLANGFARVIYSVGASVALGVPLPRFVYITGKIVNGILRFHLPEPERPALAYQLAGETLQGTFKGAGRARLTRLADIRQVGCEQPSGALIPTPPTTGPRDRLTAAELLAPTAADAGLVHNTYFLPVGQAAPALHALQGTLTVKAPTMHRARHGCAGVAEIVPGFAVAFFTQGQHLVPVVRDMMPHTSIILSPGQVWSEPGDGGLSRAAFPFVLTNLYNNETRNGLATFVYDDTRVSALRFQVSQETTAWARFDGWGQASMTYTPGPSAHEVELRAQFAAELQQQTPIQPWSALPVTAAAHRLERFDGDAAPADISASGVIMDGAIYLRGCHTRAGPYPYCRHMRHGVFSVTKSLGAAVALLRLAQQYGDRVFGLKIKDYVTVTAAHDGWERVTFEDVLNMATGIGTNMPQREPNQPFADEITPQLEHAPQLVQWARARTARHKLDVSFAFGKYPWGPGEVMRYNSTQTFVLATAMDSLLKRQAGPGAHLWDVVTRDVFQALGIFHAPMLHTQEADGGRGMPHLAHGLYLTIDDLAKLTTLLHHGGRHQGQQLLHAGKLAEALYQTQAMGLPTGGRNRYGEARYHLSFWSVPYRSAHGCFLQIPFMAGEGGSLVMLLPNGISAFRMTDGYTWDLAAMVLAGEAIRPFPCPAGAAAPPPPGRQPLTASALRVEVPGHTFYGDPEDIFPVVFGGRRTMFVAADGVLYGTFTSGSTARTADDIGRWHITPTGQFCRTWHLWEHRREHCYSIYREGERFELAAHDRFDTEVYTRVPGNPAGY